jgi:hypothetical protein
VDRSKIILGYLSSASKHAICLQQPTLTTIDSMFLYNSMNVDDIVPIDNALEKIKALEGVYFTWKNKK